MGTGTYSVGHVCCISVLTGFDMKMNYEHTDEMHGKGVRVIIADSLLRF